ncbi:hypothetical protein Ddye_018089 [Dipteronia dyeriana]|uniref:Uncharacterized protein n=1 Tax=Dipteronia dyeriana TaxID=168575 RepID=A0AAD9U9W4_9ROSI|nr:hypothetical protein Ddye_018089 [Dipteronia dyeriana]
MAENPPPILSSEDDDVQGREEDQESPAKNPISVHEHHSSSDSEADSDNTIPSPNVSDFQIKPIIDKSADTPTNKPTAGSKRPAPTAAIESVKKKERTDDERAITIVLGLPRQQNVSGKKLASKNQAKRRVKREVIVNHQELDNSLELDKGKKLMDGKSKKLLEKMLEMYMKKTELVQKQTRLILEELKSEKI